METVASAYPSSVSGPDTMGKDEEFTVQESWGPTEAEEEKTSSNHREVQCRSREDY